MNPDSKTAAALTAAGILNWSGRAKMAVEVKDNSSKVFCTDASMAEKEPR